MIKIKFCGAAKTVTGSNYIITTDHGTFAVDCGMFQGPEVEHLNLEDFEYDPSSVDFALLTHSHIDHSGRLPKLFRDGFNGPIYATNETIQVSTELLLDSAKIQENNFKRGEFYGKYTQIKAMMYNTRDAIQTIGKFKPAKFNDEFSPVEGIKVKYLKAGHILGAASIEVDIEENGTWKKIIFSGDIGRVHQTLIDSFDLEYKSEPDYVLIESLYGGQFHPNREESVVQLVNIIKDTYNNRGSSFIPCFAVERTQELLNDIRIAKESGALESAIPFWLDSPLAQRVTQIYTAALQHTGHSLFDFDNLKYVKKHKQSMGLTNKMGQVIMAGSGMADGGRIVDHLGRALENPKNSIIFVGFQAEGTLGRELTEGAKSVIIGSRNVRVKAKIHHLSGFSAHGDTGDYTAWIKRFTSSKLSKVFMIHAEIDRSLALQAHFNKDGINQTYIPSMNEEVVLN